MDDSEQRLLRTTGRAEAAVFEELMKFLNSVEFREGRLSNSDKAQQFLMSLERRIQSALDRSGYTEGVYQYLRDFKKMDANIIALHDKLNGVQITAGQIDPIRRLETGNTLDRLLGSGMAKDFVQPVRQAMYRNILLGGKITDVEETLKTYVVSSAQADSRLTRYVKQVSRDSISQYDGSVQQKIAQDLQLNATRYVGSLIRDSRKQCRRWVDMAIIMNDDLADEIRWAFNNGSGMIPDTTPDTFMIYRGGYNCRHRAIPTFKRNS
jgi:hypothetical protein